MPDKILTLHPEGKNGVNIDRVKYDQMAAMILGLLDQHAPIGFSELMKLVKKELEGKFEGSISWYYTSVKLDLEARGIVGRKMEKGKQIIVLPGKGG